MYGGFGFGITAWYRAIHEGRLRTAGRRLLYDWEVVQHYYDAGHTYMECRAKFGFAAGSWSKAVRQGLLLTRRYRFTLERLIAESKSRYSIKRRLLQAGLLENKCDDCGLTSWMGRPLSIQLDHRNEVNKDYRLENLRMLCPNCHSQAATFGIKNRKQKVPRSRK